MITIFYHNIKRESMLLYVVIKKFNQGIKKRGQLTKDPRNRERSHCVTLGSVGLWSFSVRSQAKGLLLPGSAIRGLHLDLFTLFHYFSPPAPGQTNSVSHGLTAHIPAAFAFSPTQGD